MMSADSFCLFKSMAKAHKNDSASNHRADRTVSPLLFRHIASGKTILLAASVVCSPKLYKVLCQHLPPFPNSTQKPQESSALCCPLPPTERFHCDNRTHKGFLDSVASSCGQSD